MNILVGSFCTQVKKLGNTSPKVFAFYDVLGGAVYFFCSTGSWRSISHFLLSSHCACHTKGQWTNIPKYFHPEGGGQARVKDKMREKKMGRKEMERESMKARISERKYTKGTGDQKAAVDDLT